VVRCGAVCCGVLQCVAVLRKMASTAKRMPLVKRKRGAWQRVVVCCSVLQRVATCCSVAQDDEHDQVLTPAILAIIL